jgi:ATP-dependent NAD(P)H-hydrate dehydratase
MSSTTRQLLGQVKRMVPPMLEKFHKGQLGRVAVIGGSEDYTGAPYFSAMASARLGCDMSHVICTPGAAAVIKTYSPNLMVHPLMRQTPGTSTTSSAAAKNEGDDSGSGGNLADEIAGNIIESMLPRLHVLVVGPGLGRDKLMLDTTARVVRAARDKGLAVVMDADALALVGTDPSVVSGYRAAVLTPNVVEFGRLCDAVGVDREGCAGARGERKAVEKLAEKLGGVTIIQKGAQDLVSNGDRTLVSDLKGGLKRSGGQGDTLTGSIATLLAWRKAYLDELWDEEEGGGKERLGEDEMVGLAAFGGSVITRECSRLAFEKKGRSMQASDLTDEVHAAFMTFFGDVDGGEGAKL